MSKATLTDLVALVIIIVAIFTPQPFYEPLLYTGLFALSGSLTNHLAIHMLFHRVPFLYGSGVIEQNFEALKRAILEMMLKEFFTKEHLDAFIKKETKAIDLKPLIQSADLNGAFDALLQSVMESTLGGAVQLFGGKEAFENMRDPFIKHLRVTLEKVVASETFNKQLETLMGQDVLSDNLKEKIKHIIEARLEKLDAKQTKRLIEHLMQEYLGWLVVWGGVVGGLIGLISSFIL